MQENPYTPPESEPPRNRSSHIGVKAMFTAIFGGLLVLVGAFIGLQVAGVLLFPSAYQSPTGLILSYVVTVPLAIVAAALSFRATLRGYRK